MAKCKWCAHLFVAGPKSGTRTLLRHRADCPNRAPPEVESTRPELDQQFYPKKMAVAMVKHNLPFMFVEYDGIRDVHTFLHPDAKHICRNTAKSDILKLYNFEKEKLKNTLELIPSRFCLTSDLWSLLVSDGYLALTAHYVDENWMLQKKVLSFRHLPPPHNGLILAEFIIGLLKEWNIEKKIFSITLDNATNNKGSVSVLQRHLELNDSLLCRGEFFHIRCGAHVLNLIVQAGLHIIDESVVKIRESVKYVRGSESRKIKFAECITQLSLNYSTKICQDLFIKWNSTYLMLERALLYRQAFFQLSIVDSCFKTCPTEQEWRRVESIATFLKPFFDITSLFFGSQYPTANLYFHGVWMIQRLIMKVIDSSDEVLSSMAKEMKKKFDKYWDCHNIVLFFAIILDPRYKIQFVEFYFQKLYPATYLDRVRMVRDKLFLLFQEYMTIYPHSSSSNQSSMAHSTSGGNGDDIPDELDEFDVFESQNYGCSNKLQLDLYLEDRKLDRKEQLDVLSYWRSNKNRYTNLALMARDILSIPITIVASESSFSIGGRIVDKIRSSILPQNVEALLCYRDWVYGVPGKINNKYI